ncbi:MAG: hypothetical protein ACXWHZ_03665 [Usitatibacter sp.]
MPIVINDADEPKSLSARVAVQFQRVCSLVSKLWAWIKAVFGIRE